MVKHRRYSDKPKDDSTQKEEKTEFQEQEISSEKTPLDFKSLVLSGTKYAYIIAAVALLSGIFTPLTLGVEIEDVIFGMLIIFLGLAGGIVIFLGIKYQKLTTVMVCGGLGMMVASLFLIYELLDKSLLG
tara:strand:+ start:83 stop:472 length:390 start_codon:yes stop_codon:yes gene_type:complete